MEKRRVGKILMVVAIWFMFYFLITFVIEFHEQGHKQINAFYGIDSEIVISNFGLTGKTVPAYDSCRDVNNLCYEAGVTQAEYEGFAYTVLPMFFVLFFVLNVFFSLYIVGL